MILFTRTAPGRPPRSAGLKVDEQGAVVGWQSSGQRVGRFGRTLDDGERDALVAALAAAAGAPPGAAPEGASGGGATEQVNAEGFGLSLGAGVVPPEPAATLVRLLRDLHTDLLDHPVAALELDVSTGSPATASLRHVGDQAIVVRLVDVSVRTSNFDADSAIADQSTVGLGVSIEGPVEPGWTQSIDGLEIGEPIAGGFRTVKVDGAAVDFEGDGAARPAELAWMDGDDE